jgi:nucleotide-binding universal stress UspA family protein
VALQGVVPVLLLPPRAKGFVDRDTGAATLRNVLLPIDARPHPEPGFDLIKTIARALRSEVLKVATLHVGSGTVETELLQPDGNWRVRHLLDEGPVVDRIIEHALDANADLVVCVTEGRRGFLDTLRGSTVERLIERIRVPVLIVPAQD